MPHKKSDDRHSQSPAGRWPSFWKEQCRVCRASEVLPPLPQGSSASCSHCGPSPLSLPARLGSGALLGISFSPGPGPDTNMETSSPSALSSCNSHEDGGGEPSLEKDVGRQYFNCVCCVLCSEIFLKFILPHVLLPCVCIYIHTHSFYSFPLVFISGGI